jgi:hypothetical protein
MIGWLLERCCCVDWIGLAQDRDKWIAVVNEVMNSIKFLETMELVS